MTDIEKKFTQADIDKVLSLCDTWYKEGYLELKLVLLIRSTEKIIRQILSENLLLKSHIRKQLEKRNEDMSYHGGSGLDIEKCLNKIVNQ